MGSKITCPKCRAEIPLEDVNVGTDIALCRQCGRPWSYAELVENAKPSSFNLRNPPRGTWFRETAPLAFEIGATTRSAGAFFLVPFTCVWSGGSLGGIYGSQLYAGHFNWGFSLFGIPFLLGSLALWGLAALSVCGKTIVKVNGDDGVVFTGVGPVGWRRRFNWRHVSAISRTERRGNRDSVSEQITIEGEKRLNFGAGLKEERLDFMLASLRGKWRESGHAI